MKTIEQLLKLKLQADINTAMSNKMNVIVTNDLNNYYVQNRPQENDLVLILSSGNGTRSTTENGYFITQSIAITIRCATNYLQFVLANLTNYANNESRDKNIQVLADNESELFYSCYINYNTPTADKFVYRMGTIDFTTVMLMGTLIYSESTDLDLGNDTVYSLSDDNIAFAPLINIQSNTSGPKPNISGEITQGIYTAVPVINGMGHDYTLKILYDKNNTLHNSLYTMTKNSLKSQLIKYMKIDDGVSFKVIVVPALAATIMGFKFIDISISRMED
jgi:hypothetical protein